MKAAALSFVIPAHNESGNIGRCVTSIHERVPGGIDFEVIVVDNSSEDGTASEARLAGARVVPSGARTIGAVRNAGVAVSQGDVIVFLDADCALTEEWGLHIKPVLNRISRDPLICAGSQVAPPSAEAVFLWKYWFTPFVAQASASHIGSAHMICSRLLFDRIDGFDQRLSTGEDYDFCMRVRASGGQVCNVPNLRVEHYGFPRSLSEFVKRERWHGSGDMGSLAAFVSSKVALTSLFFTLSALLAVLGGVFRNLTVALLGTGLAAGIVAVTSTVKFGHAGLKVRFFSLFIIPVYLFARTLALCDRLTTKPQGRPPTPRRG